MKLQACRKKPEIVSRLKGKTATCFFAMVLPLAQSHVDAEFEHEIFQAIRDICWGAFGVAVLVGLVILIAVKSERRPGSFHVDRRVSTFFREVSIGLEIWTLRADGEPYTVRPSGGKPVVPFWSSRSRVERAIREVPAYRHLEPGRLALEEFTRVWIPDLKRKGYLVGLNWSGRHAEGPDIEPERARLGIEALVNRPNKIRGDTPWIE